MIKKLAIQFRWLLGAVAVLLLNVIFKYFPNFVETVYSNGIFLIWRYLYDYTLGWIFFPMMYIFVLILAIVIFRFLFRLYKSSSDFSTKSRLFAIQTLNLFSILFICFYVFWGFNYKRISFEEKQNLTVNQIEFEELIELGDSLLIELNELRSELSSSYDALSSELLSEDFENSVRNDAEALLEKLDYSTGGRVRIRKLYPKGALLRISTAGVYWPFVFEGHIDPGMYFVQWPYTMSHEMFHGYGFTDEGLCNFLAYLACSDSENILFKYSGKLAFWRYVAFNIRRADPEYYKTEVLPKMNEGIKSDLKQIKIHQDKYPDFMPKIRNAVYDSYLKSNGVKEGLKSYSRIILLVNSWEKQMKENK